MSRHAEIQKGSHVVVRTVFGNEVPKVALTGVVMGSEFLVVWACSEQEWVSADRDGRAPSATPWPAEDVALRETT